VAVMIFRVRIIIEKTSRLNNPVRNKLIQKYKPLVILTLAKTFHGVYPIDSINIHTSILPPN
jgi:hypothetical protein